MACAEVAMTYSPEFILVVSQVITYHLSDVWDQATQDSMSAQIQSQCPGPYEIVWDPKLFAGLVPRFELKFNDSPETTAWLLRWS